MGKGQRKDAVYPHQGMEVQPSQTLSVVAPLRAPARTGSSRRHENGPSGAPRQGHTPDQFAQTASAQVEGVRRRGCRSARPDHPRAPAPARAGSRSTRAGSLGPARRVHLPALPPRRHVAVKGEVHGIPALDLRPARGQFAGRPARHLTTRYAVRPVSSRASRSAAVATSSPASAHHVDVADDQQPAVPDDVAEDLVDDNSRGHSASTGPGHAGRTRPPRVVESFR